MLLSCGAGEAGGVVPEGIAVVDDALAGVEGRAEIARGELLEISGGAQHSGEAGEGGIIEPDLIPLSPGTAVIGDRVGRTKLGEHEGVGAGPTGEGVERNVVDGIGAKAKCGVVGGDCVHHGQAAVEEEVARDDEVGQFDGRLTVAYDDAEATGPPQGQGVAIAGFIEW
ncbi:hypothetical protein KBZ12_10940 [Cyanobium sp. Cruz CV13-4-11]|jgi:hypothetical protein|uniref:hypothetical protein n=1 Tax=unclassified Cyanobium TaxID=2627006 RepID=UPI0020CE69F4|nr:MULTISPECIES: hypothetical protein [unclassified Cyanobium]MCP9901893.1 hypothetical protein [Cyanobium sp. Cruz CV11-17]MCP9919985.1 hypothetical protein [Cyanobium sp. Cruz CV13-4-11]